MPSALARPALRLLGAQVGLFAGVGLLALLPTQQNPAWLEVLAILATTGLVLLTIRLITGTRR